jgi:polysaccharide export outer membrane protein
VFRTVQLKFVAVVLLLIPGIAVVSLAAQADLGPPKELVQFIRDAKRRGVAEPRIKQQALAVGWSASAIDDAIASAKSSKPVPADRGDLAASSQTIPAASNPSVSVESSPTPAVDTSTSRGISDEYVIGSGDTLQISVWKEPEASVPSVAVRPDGKITMPLIKEVAVAGLTPRQAEAVITEAIGRFITDPNVTVVVAAINSKKIYLIGAVRKEGTLPYTYGMTVMQALSEAGGLTDYAKRKKIYILRTENSREYRLEFNYEEVVRGERMEQNVVLLPSDTVVVPQ